MLKKYVLACLLACCIVNISAQSDWVEWEENTLEVEDLTYWQEKYEELSELAEHPFNINTITKEQLEQLPFLSDKLIENILYYLYKYGPMVSKNELLGIEGMDWQTRHFLKDFIYIGPADNKKDKFSINRMLKYNKQELITRLDIPLNVKAGYAEYSPEILKEKPNKKYQGNALYHNLRYRFQYRNQVFAGLTAEKDAGEPFWNEYHKGYDYYSVHLFLKEMNKWLKSLAIGDYKISFGQGLVISNDFSPGRNALVSQTERRTNGFRRHFSTNENDFFRGAAATVNWKNLDINLFYSYRKLDGGVDSTIVTSFKTDGLHRLVRDREKMHKVSMQTYGGNVRYATPGLCIGLTALSYSFGNYSIQPDPKPYNLFYFRGNRNLNISVDYLLKNKLIKFYGETALSRNGAVASLNALQLTPASYFSLLLLYRYYDKRYQAFFGNAFSQNSAVRNEQGMYIGMQWTPFARWKLSAYADVFRFPWLKYGVDAPSTGKEYMLQLDYTSSRNLFVYVRYKYKQREDITPYHQQRLRMQALYTISSSVSLRTSADGICYTEANEKSRGWMIAQSVGWKPVDVPVQTDFHIAGFHTDNYRTRIFSYEKNILYAFNMPSFYGKGVRLALSFRWDIVKQLSVSAKLGYTYYADRDVVGTDLEEIEGNIKADIYTLLRWKF